MFKYMLFKSSLPSGFMVVGSSFLFGSILAVMAAGASFPANLLFKYTLIFIAVVCLPAAIIDYYYIQKRKEIIEYITRGEQDLAAGNWKRRISHPANDEFSEMIDSFNDMAENIEKAVMEISEIRLLFETLVENSINGIIVVNPEGRLFYGNPVAQKLLRMRPGDIGHNYVDVIQEYDVISSIDYARQHNCRINKELILHVLKGNTVQLAALPLKTADSRYIGVLVIINSVP